MFLLPQIAALVFAQAATAAAPKPQTGPVLQIGVFSDAPDGQVRGAAYETSLSRESFQYVGGCVMGGGNRPVPASATDAWRISGSVLSQTPDEAVIQLDWQRVRANGIAVSSPGGSVQLTLHPGDRVPLDSVTLEGTPQCPAKTVGFEARFGPRPFVFLGEGPGQLDSTRGGGISTGRGPGSGRGTAAGGAVVTNRTEVGSVSKGGAGLRKAEGAGSAGAIAIAAQEFSANLWLVRTDATGAEKREVNLQGLILEQVRGIATFAFSPFTIDTAAGPVNVQITGTLRITTDAGPQLIFTTTRTVRYASSDRNRDSSASSSGSSTTRNPMPGPDDVLSFELPPLRLPNNAAGSQDQYSVRVRIR
jgi:hypothetical protein